MGTLAGDQADIHVRVDLVETVQTRHQPVGGEGKVGRHLKHFVLVLFGDRYQSAVDGLQASLHMAEQYFAGFSKLDAAIDPVKQAGGQLLFKALDLLADGRLSSTQFDSRRSEAAQASRDFKGT